MPVQVLLSSENLNENSIGKDLHGDSELIKLVHIKDYELAEQILEKSVNVDQQVNKSGMTALLIALNIKQYKLAEKILQKKSKDVDQQDKNGVTALMTAIDRDQYKLAEKILKKTKDVDLQKNGELR